MEREIWVLLLTVLCLDYEDLYYYCLVCFHSMLLLLKGCEVEVWNCFWLSGDLCLHYTCAIWCVTEWDPAWDKWHTSNSITTSSTSLGSAPVYPQCQSLIGASLAPTHLFSRVSLPLEPPSRWNLAPGHLTSRTSMQPPDIPVLHLADGIRRQ